MPIYSGATQKTLFKGDYSPAEFYKGTQKITGYSTSTKTGVEITADNTYNDNLYPVIEGKAWQANTNPTTENPSPIILSGGSSMVTECRNILPNTSVSQTSNGVIFTINNDGSVIINGIKTNPQASSFAVLSGNFYQYQNKIVNYSLDNDYVYSGGAVGVNISARFTDGRFVPIVLGGQLRTKSFWCNNDIGCIYIEAVKSDLYDNVAVFPQLELGTTSHPYTSYKSPITMPLAESFGGVGNASDRIYSSGGKVWLEKNTDSVVFDGSEYWELQSINAYGIANFKFYNSVTTMKANTILCDRLKHQTTSIATTKEKGILNTTPDIYVRIESSIVDSVANFKQLLQSNALTVRYELATPQLTDITDTPTGQAYKNLQTYYPHTHMYSTAQDEVKPHLTAEIKEF